MPFAILLILLTPYFIFFKTFSFIDAMSKQYEFNYKTYLIHMEQILKYFWKYEFLSLLLVCKVIIAGFWIGTKNNVFSIKKRQLMQISHFFSLTVIIYIILIARIPSYLFTRYFIVLQPIITIIIILDLFIIYDFFYLSGCKQKNIFALIALVLGLVIASKGFILRNYLGYHFYELLHQYRGPLDYTIPYIENAYGKPDELVIATNYEEYSYMYYLGSKVTIGYVGNNLEEDLKTQPDIIIFRNGWGSNPQVFNYFLQKAKYKTLTFPIFNYPLNNIRTFAKST